MSDLISRKAVIDLILELLENSEYDGDKVIYAKDKIENLPTAYDVDKVVGQLENIKNERWPDNNIMSGKHKLDDYARNVIDLAISIVKGAVKDE